MRKRDLKLFRGISLRRTCCNLILLLALIFVGCAKPRGVSEKPVPPQELGGGPSPTPAPPTESNLIGRFWVTFYYAVNENAYHSSQETTIKDIHGGILAWTSFQFKKDMDIEGTGILLDGRTVNYAKVIDKEIRYRVSPEKWGWGIGQCPLKPYRTIAVDKSQIPLGTVVRIQELVGMKLPNGEIHDGIFYAEDVGGAIKENHIDLFCQDGIKSSKPFEDVGIKTKSWVTIFKVEDPNPAGCQTKEALN